MLGWTEYGITHEWGMELLMSVLWPWPNPRDWFAKPLGFDWTWTTALEDLDCQSTFNFKNSTIEAFTMS